MATWGLCATILAHPIDVLRFAAHHLEAGAHRLYLYLDDPGAQVFAPLKAHSKIRVTRCDHAHWERLGGAQPKKHQVRQSRNATHAYSRAGDVDWLAHIDVDEFLLSSTSIAAALDALPAPAQCARVRPMEQLAGSGTHFKAFVPTGPGRAAITARLYPTFGTYLTGGFLSHVAGKIFCRTGHPGRSLRIHNMFDGDTMNAGEVLLDGVDLAHCHAKTWEDWQRAYHYRLQKGSYRADLPPARHQTGAGLSLHALFQFIEDNEGLDGLRRFFDEVVADTPDLRARLTREGLLRRVNLNLDAKLARHFPHFSA